MKKFGFFNPFLFVTLTYLSRGNWVNTPQDLRVSKTVQVTGGIKGLNHRQGLILLLVALFSVTLFGLAVYHVIRRLIRIERLYREHISSVWIDESDAHGRKTDDPDLSLGMFTEQQ